MCRKFKFIADMDNKSIKDYLAYTQRSKKIYMIFGVLALINIVETFSGADHILRWLTILGVLLYACIIATLTLMGNLNEKDSNLKPLVLATIVCLVLNSANNLAEFIYIFMTDYTWTIFFSLLSLILQVTTWYIFIGFSRQVDKEAAGNFNENFDTDAVVTPMQRGGVPIAEAVVVNNL